MKKEGRQELRYRDWIVNKPKIRLSIFIVFILSIIFLLFVNFSNKITFTIIIWVLGAIIVLFLYYRDKERGIKIVSYEKKTKGSLWEGWLSLITFGVFLATISSVILIVVSLFMVFREYSSEILFTLIIAVIFSIISIITLINEIKRKKSFKIWILFMTGFSLITLIAIYFFNFVDAKSEISTFDIIFYILSFLLITVYIIRSKRIKSTFVK